jgi:HK97 gp10 family phage protein
MTVRVKLETKGLSEYLERIQKAGQDIDRVAGEMLEAGGEILLGGMQRRVPKDTHNLEHHLDIDGPHQDGNFHYIEVGLVRGTDADTARYGNAQEYGTARTPAQSYIRPTIDHDMTKARKAMKDKATESGIL